MEKRLSDMAVEAADSAAVRAAIDLYNMAADHGDPWGSVMGAWFDVAEEISRRGAACPESWHYRSVAGGPPEAEGDFAELLGDLTPAELADLGNRLETMAEAIKAAGRDY